VTEEQYKDIIKQKLTDKRYKHSLAVADEAKRLAKKYGADPEKAYVAGLLHDICKNTEVNILLQTAKEFDIILCSEEKAESKLLHARLGAEYVKRVLGVEDIDIINAIRYHTTARADMPLFEKILYLADFTSSDRDYDGVETMRRLVEKGIKPAMHEALVFTLKDLITREHAIHPDTVAAYNQIIIQH